MTAKFLSVRLEKIGFASFLVFVFDIEGVTRSCYVNTQFLISVFPRTYSNNQDIITFRFSKKTLSLKYIESMSKDDDFFYASTNTFCLYCGKGLGESILKQILSTQN